MGVNTCTLESMVSYHYPPRTKDKTTQQEREDKTFRLILPNQCVLLLDWCQPLLNSIS